MRNPLAKLKAPQFLEDLYRDLRDRRLLPLVILLLVAIVAVPVALSAGSSPSPAPPAVPAAVDGTANAPEAQSAVLVHTPGLRDYRERLEALKANNPFKQKFQFSGLGRTQIAAVPVGGTEIGAVGGGGGAAETPSGPATSTVTSSGETGEPSSTGTGGVRASSRSKSSGSETKKVTHLITYRADLRFGPEGDVDAREGVKSLTVLEPVAVFVGISEDGTKALFLVSSDVTNPLGEGTCLEFSGSPCGLLVLEVGEEETLDYPLDGKTYKLKLVDVHRVRVD